VQTNKALNAIIGILYNGTEVDLDELKAKVKSFASPEAVMEELLEHVFI
jgi:translation elongation factor EF-1beta